MIWLNKTENAKKWFAANRDKVEHFVVPKAIQKGVDAAIAAGIDLKAPMDFSDAEWRQAQALRPL